MKHNAISHQQEMQAVTQQRPRRKRTTMREATAGMSELLKSRRLVEKEVSK